MDIPVDANNLYEKAEMAIEEKEYNEALSYLENALKIVPDYVEALSLSVYVHYKLKFVKLSKEEVFKRAQRAIDINDKSTIAWHHMGNAYSFTNKFDDAIRCYNRTIELGLENEKLYNNLGSAYLKNGDLDKALENYNKAMTFNENFPPLFNNMGYLFSRKGEFEKSLQFFDMAIEADPDYSPPWNNKGNLFSELGDYDNAIECYKKAMEIEPDSAILPNNLGTLYILKKDFDRASELFERAIELDSEYGDPWTNLGLIFSDKSKYERAIECYDKALELNPKLYKAWYNKGNVYCKTNSFSNAIDSYKEAIRLNPSYLSAWTNLGSTFFKIQDFPNAKKYINQAISLNPNSKIDLFNLGNVYRFEGNFIEAIQSFQKVLDLDINFMEAWFNQGISHLMIKNLDMAILCLEEAINLDSQNIGIWGNLGIAYAERSDFINAKRCMDIVLQMNPDDILALTIYGHLFINNGEIEKAIPYFQKALELKPTLLIQVDKLGYEFYASPADPTIKSQNSELSIPLTSDIYVYIGMGYHQLGNDEEALNFLNKALDEDRENFIAFANIGILNLNNFNFEKAIIEFDKAINLIKEKGIMGELEKVEKFKVLAERAIDLGPKLEIIDEKIIKLLKLEDFKELSKLSLEIDISLEEMLKQININDLPEITKNLLLSKYKLFKYLYRIFNFDEIDDDNISVIHELYSFQTDFIKFFYSLQNFKDIVKIFKGYNKFEEISETASKQIIKKIKNLESLGSELSSVITGSLGKSPESSSPVSRRAYPGIENSLLNEDALTSEKIEITNYDLLIIREVCKELHTLIPKYKNIYLKISDFLYFISQFPEPLRLCIARVLKRIKYITLDQMGDLILNEVNNIVEEPKKAYLISFKKGWQKSQETWNYLVRKFSGENFKSIKVDELLKTMENIKNDEDYYFIFLDDVILTGSQFEIFFKEEMKDIMEDIENICNSNENIHFYIIAGLGSFESKRYISKLIRLFNKNMIRYGDTLKDRDKAFFEGHFSNLNEREELIKFLQKKHPNNWNGYKDSQALVVLEWNTPDNTIGCVRKSTDDWYALFPRN